MKIIKQLLWFALLAALAIPLARFSVIGLSRIMPVDIAATLAWLVMFLFGAFAHFAKAKRSWGYGLMAVILWLVASVEFAMSGNEHLKSEGKQRLAKIETGVSDQVAARDAEAARARIPQLQKEVEEAVEEAARMKTALLVHERNTAQWSAELAEIEGQIAVMDNDGKKANDAMIPPLQAKAAQLREKLSATASPTPGEVAAKENLAAERKARVTRAEQEVAALAAQASAASKAHLNVDAEQYFLFSLADRWSHGESDIGNLIVVGLWFVLGLAIQGSFGLLFTVQVKPEEKAIDVPVPAASPVPVMGVETEESEEEEVPPNVIPMPPQSDPEEIAALARIEQTAAELIPVMQEPFRKEAEKAYRKLVLNPDLDGHPSSSFVSMALIMAMDQLDPAWRATDLAGASKFPRSTINCHAKWLYKHGLIRAVVETRAKKRALRDKAA